MINLTFAPAHQLAQMIRDRQVSAVEVLDAHLIQIAKHNSKLNAICTLDEDNALTRAKQADEALVRLGVQLTLMADPILMQWQTEPTRCPLI